MDFRNPQTLGNADLRSIALITQLKTDSLAFSVPFAEIGGDNRGASQDAAILIGDEIDRLLGASNKSQTATLDRALIVIVYRAGLRCTELRSLKPKDLDVSSGSIRVQ